MNSEIIKRHNERVKPGDMVIYVGDFCFRNSKGGKPGEGAQDRADFYLKQLNGMFIPIQGNHDNNNSLKTPIESMIIEYANQKIFVTHKPEDARPDFKYNFVGHIHNAWKFKKLNSQSYLINVGCDVWDFYPRSYEEIMNEFYKWRKSCPNEEK